LQRSTFVEAENMPDTQSAQSRFDVVLGADETCLPAAHTACGRQKPFPGKGWKLLLGHGSHAPAFSTAENCPATQILHALPSMNVPGLHVPQYPSDAPPQPLRFAPLGHAMLLQAMHCACPVAFWKDPAAHGSQLPELALNVPTLQAMHTPALVPPQPLRSAPAVQLSHAEHDSAPTAALNAEAGHSSQCASALVRGSAAPALPLLPAAHASQLVLPPNA
jgi:hypothetical protein